MGEHVALPEKDSDSSVAQCRICHEEEDNDLKDMGSPCACSGTLKKFEPGFTVSAQTANIKQMTPLIRGELHTSSENQELRSSGLAVPVTVAVDGGSPVPNFRGSSFSTCCRLVALMLFLLRAGGVLLPFYIMVHAVSVIQRRQQAREQEYDGDLQNHRYLDEDVQELYLRV
ncbi:hypothetical protein EJ110_NYTH40693 [Nymphaea thermarum]|nr:hypothetical protein EJ110_NYTH40693 [Nymphaea thermarum]